MTYRIRLALLAGVCTLPIIAAPAHAQDAAQGDSDSSAAQSDRNVIIVTANKRDENLQDVPISITAFSQEELDKRGVSGLAGIQEATPNLNFSVQSAGQNVARVTLRGVGTETLVGGGDPGVALHIDGVYVGRNSAAAGDIFDVERVEVLRGPQGTLYGRNATGGSVNIITQKPVFDLTGFADVSYGNYNSFRVRGVVNVPLSDTVAARVTGFSDSHDGYTENLFEAGRDNNDKNTFGGRLQLLWEPSDGMEFLLRGYLQKNTGAGPGSRYLGDDINTANGYPGGYLIGISDGSGPPAGAPIVADAFNLATTTNGNGVLDRPTGFREIRKDAPEFVDTVMKGIDFEASVDLSDSILLRSTSSYQTNDNEILVDADNSELPLEIRQRDNSAEQFSQEFNLISQGESAFQWILGAYYYHEELTETFSTVTPPGLVPLATPLPPGAVPGGGGVAQLRITNHTADSYALFGQVSYDITDRLNFTAGLRHTWDDKIQDRETGGNVDLTNNFRFMGGGATGPLAPDRGEVSFSEFTYRASLSYEVADDHLLFASYSRGYKTGGFDFNGGRIDTNGEQLAYNPEFVKAYEIGSKNEFLDGALRFNVTGFYYDYTDLQVFRLTGDGPLTDNAAESTIWGVEVESSLEVTDGLTLQANIGYLDATYDDYVVERPPPAVNFAGNRLNYAPEWTVFLAAEYAHKLNNGADLVARLDWAYRSKTFFDRANTDLDTQEGYGLINARVRYDAESWFVDVFGRNLGDVEYVTGQLINPPFACGCRTVNVGNPRTYGATFGVRF
ncbi:TonB-dependent receptor [Altererythrobacter sp. ZODW24]|uniref:TonB-dependent receptor n=1 Tax=Altererythrobacter sp. ZODW24 TaxID=2185142 RepID=UPI000DF7AEA5|nr:TonB-dependent receptor [Altererythrobacter sp. ZODW24]